MADGPDTQPPDGRVRLPPMEPDATGRHPPTGKPRGENRTGIENVESGGSAKSYHEGPTGADVAGSAVPVRHGGARVYAAFLVGAAAAVCISAMMSVYVLVVGVPKTAAEAGTASATLWRVAYTALLINLPRSVMIMGPFAMAFVMDTRGLVRRSLAVAGAWAILLTLIETPTPGSESTLAIALLACWALLVPGVTFLPIRLVSGLPKRGDASARTPVWKAIFIASVVMASIALLVDTWISGVYPAYLVVLIIVSVFAMQHDTPENTFMDEWYLITLVVITYGLPLSANKIVQVLLDNLDQTDPLESLGTALGLGAFLFLAFQLQYAFARRALPARHRAIALFPLQVFEDVFAEFFFANARVFSGGFFVLLAVQIARTLGRDTGAFEEAKRMLANWWRARRGQEPVPRADDAVVDWVRIWLQNMVSELTAMFVFVGAIAGEEARGDEIGSLTDLDHGDRMALLGGYGVVFLFEAAAHVVSFVVLRRAVQLEQARGPAELADGRVSIVALRVQGLAMGEEARKLVERHGLYLLATLLAVTLRTLSYARELRIEYD